VQHLQLTLTPSLHAQNIFLRLSHYLNQKKIYISLALQIFKSPASNTQPLKITFIILQNPLLIRSIHDLINDQREHSPIHPLNVVARFIELTHKYYVDSKFSVGRLKQFAKYLGKQNQECADFFQKIKTAKNLDEIEITWEKNPENLFYFGMAFMSHKPIRLSNREAVSPTPHKSYENVLLKLDELARG